MLFTFTRRTRCCAALLVLGLFLVTAAGTASTTADDGVAISPEPVQGEDAQVTKIDLAGEKLGKRIDSLTERAASRLGKWVDAEVVMGITWLKLAISFLMLLMTVVFERVVRALMVRHRKQAPPDVTSFTIKDHLVDAAERPLSLVIWSYGTYASLIPLMIHFRHADGTNLVHTVVQKAADLGAAVALIWFIFSLVDLIDARLNKWAGATESTIDDMLAPLLGKTLRIFIVLIGAILVVQNLTGVELGPLLASLGVGGIAVALAAKDSIANFFGTLTILFDKPFQIGQRIVIDTIDGTVESVGFRSTRIRTLTGHLVTIPNEKLVNTSIENIGMRPHIRWLTHVTITYDTPPEKVEQAVAILSGILANHEGMDPEFPPRVFFNGFNDWSLNILMVAWYHPPDYWAMQAWQQRTCLEILRRFNAAGIDFAFPSRTVYVANDDNRQIRLKMLTGDVSFHPTGER